MEKQFPCIVNSRLLSGGQKNHFEITSLMSLLEYRFSTLKQLHAVYTYIGLHVYTGDFTIITMYGIRQQQLEEASVHHLITLL